MRACFFVFITLFVGQAFADDVTFYATPATKAAGLPFSDAVRVGDMVYLSGTLGTADGALVDGGIEAEAHAIFVNMQRTLAAHDLALSNIVKCTVMLADINDYGDFNRVYSSYFPNDKPARSAFAASALALGAAVELECWAAVP